MKNIILLAIVLSFTACKSDIDAASSINIFSKLLIGFGLMYFIAKIVRYDP